MAKKAASKKQASKKAAAKKAAVKSEIKNEPEQPVNSEFNNSFKDFLNNESEHIVTPQQQQTPPADNQQAPPTDNQQAPPTDNQQAPPADNQQQQQAQQSYPQQQEQPLTVFDQFKLQMFLGLIFALLDGFHVWFYRFISGKRFKKEDIALDDDERESLEPYFQSQQVLQLINKMPNWLIGVMHTEWIYYSKFKDINTEDIEEEEEEEEEEKIEKPKKKAAAKKRANKK